ncbi:MAG: 4-hydroxy-tetrahydrodipicolinate reductase [Gemmatimonadota bacterium]
MRILVVGDGQMGRAVADRAAAAGHEVVAALGADVNRAGRGIALWRGRADVAIEFTGPSAAVENIMACLESGLPVVTGTTGWYGQRAEVETRARECGGALLVAPNFSLGVAILMELAGLAAGLAKRHGGFGAAITEVHHARKKDAPSGTALALAAEASEGFGSDIPISSVRVGSVPGTHSLVLDAPFEQIVLTHEARDRRVFADGAVRAAGWLVGRTGVFSMRDMTRNG